MVDFAKLLAESRMRRQTLDVDPGLPDLGARTAALYVQSTGEAAGADPLHGLPAAIGVDFPLTHRVGNYFGQPRDPEQVIASKIDELDAIERSEDAPGTAVPLGTVGTGDDRSPADSDRTPTPLVDAELWPDPTPPFCYLAGPAGSGKTFAVKDWQQREKGLMLCATTGIAAINLGGTTINACLGYFDTKSLQESYTNGFLTARLGRLWRCGVTRLVVDEVSMLSGDQLTYLVKAIEEVNGRGYVLGKWTEEDEAEPPAMGLTLVGDFAQLPPVKEPFAWESPEWPRFAEQTLTLTQIRRQADAAFIEALRQARVGNGRAVLEALRSQLAQETDDHFEGPTLFAKNEAVNRYNWIRLSRVTGADLYYESRRDGEQRSEWGSPKKDPQTWGIPIRFHTKVGALVMVLANAREEGPPPQPFLYVNGDLGEVLEGEAQSCLVRLQRNGREVQVTYCRREVLVPCDSARRKELRAAGQQGKISENGKFEITGWIEYLPLRTAYASTVHKSQGLSLDRIQVNIRDAFFKSCGMVYVALSRCRTREGLRIVGSEAALIERCAADPRLKDWL